jgi:hypothetical protein
MHFSRDCGVSSVLVRQPGRPSCTIVHSGSQRGASLHLLPWMVCMTVLQEQKQVTKKLLFLEAPQADYE